jgi:type IV pilus assembly protein PilZ
MRSAALSRAVTASEVSLSRRRSRMQSFARRSGRSELEVSVDLRSEQDRYAAKTKNIGSGGVFVATPRVLGVGDRVTLSFSLPGIAEPLTVDASVRWIRPPTREVGDGEGGMGLQFINMSLDTSVIIQRYLRDKDPLYRPDSENSRS